jgi:hypothetical protein
MVSPGCKSSNTPFQIKRNRREKHLLDGPKRNATPMSESSVGTVQGVARADTRGLIPAISPRPHRGLCQAGGFGAGSPRESGGREIVLSGSGPKRDDRRSGEGKLGGPTRPRPRPQVSPGV